MRLIHIQVSGDRRPVPGQCGAARLAELDPLLHLQCSDEAQLLLLLYCLIVDLFIHSDTPFFGGHSEEVPPVPIPNTAVKLLSADGTAGATLWESRSPPNPFLSQTPCFTLEARGLLR